MAPRRKVPGERLSPEEAEIVNINFVSQVEQFRFHYQCHSCLHNDPEAQKCSMRYPRANPGPEEHRCRGDEGELLFCKYFELR